MTNLGPASELMALLDVQFDECAPTRVRGSIAADDRHHQPRPTRRRPGSARTRALGPDATLNGRRLLGERAGGPGRRAELGGVLQGRLARHGPWELVHQAA